MTIEFQGALFSSMKDVHIAVAEEWLLPAGDAEIGIALDENTDKELAAECWDAWFRVEHDEWIKKESWQQEEFWPDLEWLEEGFAFFREVWLERELEA